MCLVLLHSGCCRMEGPGCWRGCVYCVYVGAGCCGDDGLLPIKLYLRPMNQKVKLGEDSFPEGEGCACARFSPPTRPGRPPSRPGDSRAGPVARCLGREERAPCPRAPRRPPLPLVPSVPSRPVPSGAAGRVLRRVGGSGDIF